MKKLVLYPLIALSLFFIWSEYSFACESCGCTLARIDCEQQLPQANKPLFFGKPLFFDFTFEQQVWHKRDPQLAFDLGQQGHDTHDKTHEEFYHFSLGANPVEWVTVLAELPYVVRHSIVVDDADHLGERERSEGFGDLMLTSVFKILKQQDNFTGPVVGIKMPTGVTSVKNDQGNKFEPELQPGSGSFDPIMGGAFRYQLWQISLHGNVLYTIRTKGAQEFQFGNLFSTYLYADYLLNPKSTFFATKVGLDMSLQNEQRQRNHGVTVEDSGGTTLMLGPEISVQGNKNISAFGNFLSPVYQDLGGVHQHVQFIWNAGIKIAF